MEIFLFLFLMVVGTFFLGLTDVVQRKYLCTGLDEQLLLGVAWLVAGFLLTPFLFIFGVPPIQSGFWGALGVTIILNIVSQNLFIRAFKLTEASLIAPLRFLTPVFTLVTGFLFLGERPTLGGIVGIFVTIFGLWFMVTEGDSWRISEIRKRILKNRGLLFGLIGSVLFAISLPFDKKAVVTSSALFMVVLSFFTVGGVTMFFNILGRKDFRGELLKNVRLWKFPLVVIAALQAIGTLLTNQALAYSLVAYAASLKRLWSFWTVILAGQFLKERAFGYRLFATIIMLSGVVIMVMWG